jgi:hypothetical protein
MGVDLDIVVQTSFITNNALPRTGAPTGLGPRPRSAESINPIKPWEWTVNLTNIYQPCLLLLLKALK